ncbi:MAG: purine-nucleoside phosphorylase [Flavobacteriales bacterium]
MLTQLKQTTEYLQSKIKEQSDFVIVLGSGLGKLTDEIEDPLSIPYDEIPNFPNTAVQGHLGKLIYGKIHDKKVLVMSGRFHYYEGHSMSTVVFPIRVFKMLNINKLILSNASGGVNPSFKVGDVMLIEDHINMMLENPLRGPNIDTLGPRFVNMNEPYDKEMIKIAENVAKNHNIYIHKGTYVALQGPTFETPAEYGMVQKIGGDAVGMSTVPEVIVAKHMGMRVFALSVITDLGGADMKDNYFTHEDVLHVGHKAMPSVISIVKGLIHSLPPSF